MGEILPYALAVAISPIPIIAVILMLLSRQAGGASRGFLVGWVAGIVLATSIFVILANTTGLASSGGDSAGVSWIKLLLGVLMVALAVKQWKNRGNPELPGWMKAINQVTPAKAVTLGLLLSAVNPKNLMMCVAAGVSIASGGHQILLIVVFTVIAACTVAIPVIGYAVASERMRGPLDTLKAWLQQNNATVMFVLLLVIGVVLIGKAL